MTQKEATMERAKRDNQERLILLLMSVHLPPPPLQALLMARTNGNNENGWRGSQSFAATVTKLCDFFLCSKNSQRERLAGWKTF
jgi:hypothetical protein